MPGKRPGETSRRLKVVIPDGGHVIVVGRTKEDCDRILRLLQPRCTTKGATLKAFSQLHQMEELGGEKADVLILHSGLGPTARETVVWTVQRTNRSVDVIDLK